LFKVHGLTVKLIIQAILPGIRWMLRLDKRIIYGVMTQHPEMEQKQQT